MIDKSSVFNELYCCLINIFLSAFKQIFDVPQSLPFGWEILTGFRGSYKKGFIFLQVELLDRVLRGSLALGLPGGDLKGCLKYIFLFYSDRTFKRLQPWHCNSD